MCFAAMYRRAARPEAAVNSDSDAEASDTPPPPPPSSSQLKEIAKGEVKQLHLSYVT